LPEKPVLLTFDDGHLNNLTELLPLLEKYDFKAVVAVVGAFTEKAAADADPDPRYAYLTWEDIAKLHKSGRVEIQNHTYDMHQLGKRNGCQKKRGEKEIEYQCALRTDLDKLQTALKEKSGVTPTTFVYPFGAVCKSAEPVVREMFAVSFGCAQKINYIPKDPDALYGLCRFNRAGGLSTETAMKRFGID
jgi:peptidoglycan/xylan/chitin deacetylase (PgdA/CDA1 family)